jgi:hypothetical protein
MEGLTRDADIRGMTCPNCAGPMTIDDLEGQLGIQLAIERCASCQVFWFDRYESLKLTPGATLRLFRAIGAAASTARGRRADVCKCPRCGLRLVPTHDRQRNTPFEYLRCPQGHGRLTTYYDFLREKNFITPLSDAQVEELRRHVMFVNCSNCGAPIDLAQRSSCAHCGSALSMVDLKQAGELVALLRDADRRAPRDRDGSVPRAGAIDGASRASRGVDPLLPLALQRARREVESAFAAFEGEPRWYDDVSAMGLVGAGLSALTKWVG